MGDHGWANPKKHVVKKKRTEKKKTKREGNNPIARSVVDRIIWRRWGKKGGEIQRNT